MLRFLMMSITFACHLMLSATSLQAMTAAEIVETSFDHTRGKASVSTVVMTIHRPGWQREMVMDAWTLGQTESLIRILAPAKDQGNGTLKKSDAMWTYNPKVNRTIKLPPSMMSQAWMGSDFSNNDLAKSDSLLHDYVHTLKDTQKSNGHIEYLIESMPKPDAPVVWGMQRLRIRDDFILLSQSFFDEDLTLVKTMTCHDIRQLGGRLYPSRWRMQRSDVEGEYTELIYRQLTFKETLPATFFTLSSLKTRRK